jgi:hypothetical protein
MQLLPPKLNMLRCTFAAMSDPMRVSVESVDALMINTDVEIVDLLRRSTGERTLT